MGSAIESFDGAGAVVVPRTRFAPVKTTCDLFVLRSDVFTITPAATVEATVPKVGPAQGALQARYAAALPFGEPHSLQPPRPL